MAKKESNIERLSMVELSKIGCLMSKNNKGVLPDRRGIPVRFGLFNFNKQQSKEFKSSDLIGITPVVITPEMVGSTIGVFTGLEAKKANWHYVGSEHEEAQKNFLDTVKRYGGIAGFFTSPIEAVTIVHNFIHNLKGTNGDHE